MNNIINILIAERDKLNVEREKLNKAIEALDGGLSGAPTFKAYEKLDRRQRALRLAFPAKPRTRKPWSAAQKTAAAKRMKAYWAKKRKAA